ncbi:MAG: TolC family protein [Gammaproteobacteria bacterium]|nr:TolC family protein [Gammaproteobacteria bacterium]
MAGTGETGGFDDAEATFALSQVIELGDKRESRIGLGQAGRDAMTIDRAAAQLDVLADVARRFITVAQRQQQLQLSREAVELAQHTVVASERRVNAAKSPHAELDRARIALDRTLLEERGAGIELDTARSQLAATWGENGASDQRRAHWRRRGGSLYLAATGRFSGTGSPSCRQSRSAAFYVGGAFA